LLNSGFELSSKIAKRLQINSETEYYQAQPFKQILVWIFILGFAGFMWYSVYHQIILSNPMGSRPAPDMILLIFWVIFGILFPAGLIKARLFLAIDKDYISYRFFPLHLNIHRLPLHMIQDIESVRIRPIIEFGGFGIRYGFKGKGYIMGGKKGIKVSFYSGRPVYFSSDNPDSAVQAFQKVKKKLSSV